MYKAMEGTTVIVCDTHTDWPTVRDNNKIATNTSLYTVRHPRRFHQKQLNT